MHCLDQIRRSSEVMQASMGQLPCVSSNLVEGVCQPATLASPLRLQVSKHYQHAAKTVFSNRGGEFCCCTIWCNGCLSLMRA